MEADNGVDLSGMTMNNIQGDFVYLSPPYDVDTTSDALNKTSGLLDRRFRTAAITV